MHSYLEEPRVSSSLCWLFSLCNPYSSESQTISLKHSNTCGLQRNSDSAQMHTHPQWAFLPDYVKGLVHRDTQLVMYWIDELATTSGLKVLACGRADAFNMSAINLSILNFMWIS